MKQAMHRWLAPLISLLLLSCGPQEPQKKVSVAQTSVNAMAISSDNKIAIVASTNQEIGVWDLNKKKLRYTWRHHQGKIPNIIALSISHDNHFAVTAERRQFVWWDLTTGKPLKFLSTQSDIQALALSANGQHLLIGQNNAKAIYIHLPTGQKLKEFSQYETINSVALSNDGLYAITAGDDKLAILWDLKNNKPLHQWQHDKRVQFSTFSNDSTYALTAAPQSSISIWGVKSGKLISQIRHKSISITDGKFSKDGLRYAIGVIPNQLQLHKTKSSKTIQSWRIPKKTRWKPTSTLIYAVSFSSNQSIITGDSQGEFMWWRIS